MISNGRHSKAPESASELTVFVQREGSTLRIRANDDVITLQLDEVEHANVEHFDFVAWLMLPVAMRLGCNLRIEAAGSAVTEDRAARLARIWARWLPSHFKAVSVSFARMIEPKAGDGGDLCLYSGGIDSTYALLRRQRAGQRQSLLTIHGMDYRYEDGERFAGLLEKTSPFANLVGDRRLLIRTDAYSVYKRHRVNPKGSDVGHAFVLAAATFLYSETFSRAVIAADYRLDQQFDVHPWGTNAATNPLFDDGSFRLHTEDEDITRAEKCVPLLASDEALKSLTFCVDYHSRPHNCGKCQKCVRTKAMFVAAGGQIPKIFLDDTLVAGCLSSFDLSKKHQRAFFLDLYEMAVLKGHVDAIPELAARHRAMQPRWQRKWGPWLRSLVAGDSR